MDKTSLPLAASASFALVAELLGAMASSTAGSFWKDDEIVVDRDGIPHYTGARPELMKEYRRRVLFAFQSLEGDGDNEEKERRDLAKKKKAFARRLLNGLHGEAWRTCQGLITEPEKLSEEQGFKHVLSALQSIEKVTVVKKTEQFDRFFERGFRKKGQPLDQYLRVRRQDWADLKDLDEHTSMSDDLLAYFILKQCGLGRDERRQILLNSGSSYDLDSIERAMRVSFHDIHERERQKNFDDRRPKGSGKSRKHFAHLVEEDEVHAEIDALENERASAYESVHEYEHASGYDKVTEYDKVLEYDEGTNYEHGYGANDEPDEEPSDFGASGDDEIYAAFATMDKQRNTYQESRKRLRDIQRQRGFFKGELTFEQRKAAVAKEKERSRCPACGRMGHWAGDKECPVNNRAAGPHRSKGGGKHKKKGSGKGKAYLVSEQPLFFSLDDDDSGDVVEANSQMMAYMVGESAEFNLMDQDAGYTEQDDRRKIRQSAPSYVDDGQSDTPWAVVDPHPSLPVMQKNQEPGSPSSRDQIIRRQLQQPVRVEQSQVQIVPVANLAVLCPEIESMKVEELKKECERWGIRVSGNRSELRSRLWSLFAGHPVARKGCVKTCRAEDTSLLLQVLHPLQRVRAGQRTRNQSLEQKRCRSRWARFCLWFVAQFVVQTWCSGRIPTTSPTSSVAASLERLDAEVPWHMTVASRCHKMPTAASAATDGSKIDGPGIEHFAYANGPEVHGEKNSNLCDEPNPAMNEIPAEQNDEFHPHNLKEDSPTGELDESRVCLLDTACTSCMHSERWRLAYSRHLQDDLVCEPTSKVKTFHFADGSSTQALVWKIPIVLGGHRGEVLSAEVKTGSTPLLLSVTSMEALGMDLLLRRRVVHVSVLSIEMPMLMTRTKHRAIDITDNGKYTLVEPDAKRDLAAPLVVSANEDLFLYLIEEAAYGICDVSVVDSPIEFVLKADASSSSPKQLKLGARGVHAHDSKGTMSERRSRELSRALQHVQVQDKRTWIALRRSYTFAEQAATRQFRTTVLFEPWGGTFGVTRYGSEFFGWTNSQPLDLIDGIDLLTSKGQRLLWKTLDLHDPFLVILAFDCRIWSLLNNLSKTRNRDERMELLRNTIGKKTLLLIVRICKHRHARGRYYLIENPSGSLAWIFQSLLEELLLDEWGGKFIIGDQCAYGKIDLESRKPVRKSTGWLSNNEPVLNALGKKCRWAFGCS